jgi:hypothetical protein
MTCNWKVNWTETRENYARWWEHRGLVLNLGDFPANLPHVADDPGEALTPQQKHTDADWVATRSRALRANRDHGIGDVLPVAFVDWGTVSLAAYLGAEVELGTETIWYHPRPGSPRAWGELRFSPDAPWFRIHEEIYRQSVRIAAGDYVIGQPGIGSNIEVLAALRGGENLMLDLVEEPEWVQEKLWEINQAFFDAYSRIHDMIKLPDDSICSSYFALWGRGRTSVITLDPVAMISPAMFEQYVLPPLVEQVRWLDHSMLHVDGTAALRHLDMILGIEELDAVQWTPEPGVPGGGDPRWYELYRQIRAAGKSVMAILVKPEEVIPLLDAVGPEGMYITAYCDNAQQAEDLVCAVEPYRQS